MKFSIAIWVRVFTQLSVVCCMAVAATPIATECDRFGTCSQKCQVVEGLAQCSCTDGFRLMDDNSCALKDPDWKLLFANESHLSLISSSDQNSVTITSEDHSNSVTSDVRKDVVYSTGDSTIFKTSLRGSGKPEVVANAGIKSPSGIAFDWITGNIYFVDGSLGSIAVCTQNPTNCAVVAQEEAQATPTGIALHPNEGIMFWTISFKLKKFIYLPIGGAVIRTAGMDGSGPKTIVSPGNIFANSITVDQTSSRIYWVPLLGDKIESSRFDGSDRQVLIVSDLPLGLDILGDRIFWNTWTTDKIMSSNKLTGQNETTIMTNCSSRVVSLMHITKQPKLRANPCEDLKCSHICVLSGSSAQCICPTGMLTNGNNCVDDEMKPKLLLAQGDMLFEMRVNAIGKDVFERIYLPPQIRVINALVYNPINKTIIISDNETGNIVEYNMKSKMYRVLVESVNVTSLDIDLIGENLIWTDGVKQTIDVLSLETLAHAVVRNHVENPRDILFVPDRGTIYLSKTGKTGDEEIHEINFGNKSSDSLFDKCTYSKAPTQLAYNQETGGLISVISERFGITIKNDTTEYKQFDSLPMSLSSDSVVDVVKIENQIFWVNQKNDVIVIVPNVGQLFICSSNFYKTPTDFNNTSSSNSSEFRKVLASINPSVVNHVDKLRKEHDCSPINPNRKPCSHICFATGRNTLGKCWCPVGFHLDAAGLTCQEDQPNQTKKIEEHEALKTTSTTVVAEIPENTTLKPRVMKDNFSRSFKTTPSPAAKDSSDSFFQGFVFVVVCGVVILILYCCAKAEAEKSLQKNPKPRNTSNAV